MALVAFVILGILIFLLTSSKAFSRKPRLFTFMDDAAGAMPRHSGPAQRLHRSASSTRSSTDRLDAAEPSRANSI